MLDSLTGFGVAQRGGKSKLSDVKYACAGPRPFVPDNRFVCMVL